MAKRRTVSLSHLDERGRAAMVDVTGKEPTVRTAVASAFLTTRPAVLDAILGRGLTKGDALAAASLAGVMAAKKTGEWIPLCHPLPVEWARIDFGRAGRGRLRITATVRTTARTGVEMEALTAASAAALTIYDMAKAADKGMVIGPIQLETKKGGKSGPYERRKSQPPKRRNGR